MCKSTRELDRKRMSTLGRKRRSVLVGCCTFSVIAAVLAPILFIIRTSVHPFWWVGTTHAFYCGPPIRGYFSLVARPSTRMFTWKRGYGYIIGGEVERIVIRVNGFEYEIAWR